MTSVLKMLLTDRHLTTYPDFLVAYDRSAAQLDPPIPPGYGPGRTQFYRWLSGGLVGLPREYHRRVLAKMFPGWTIEELFRPARARSTIGAARGSELPATDRELVAFLGAEMLDYGLTLVRRNVELQLRPPQARQAAESPHPCTVEATVTPSAVNQGSVVLIALPENEIRGLLYFACALHRRTGVSIHIRGDHDVVAHGDRPRVGFGLTCNDCARLHLDSVEHPLFTLRGNWADDRRRCGQLELELPDGNCYDLSGDRSIGVIARVRPSPELHGNRYWVFCAGWGPRGTTGASWYLANRWSLLQRRAGDRGFLAVLCVGDNADDTAHLEHL